MMIPEFYRLESKDDFQHDVMPFVGHNAKFIPPRREVIIGA
jgi:hypothetical protein